MHRKRLDEILIEEGLVSESEIRDALLRQRAHSGRFGSQLLFYRAIDEAGLVKALCKQLNCQGVVISDRDIPAEVVKMVPRKVALARKVMPFEYDPVLKVLKVGCEDPGDQALVKELTFVVSGKEIELYVAAELALNTAISKYYLGRDVALDDNLLLEIPEDATMSGEASISGEEADEAQVDVPAVLFITDEEYAATLLQSVLEREGFKAIVSDDAENLTDLVGEYRFHTVFVRDGVVPDDEALAQQIRRLTPSTSFRRYKDMSDIIIGDALTEPRDLLISNLDLFTSLLASKAELPRNHSGLVGHYAEKLCRKMGLPERDCVLITDAAYLHDIARFYYPAEQAGDNSRVVQLTCKLLASLCYSPDVLKILGSMYLSPGKKYVLRLPMEVLGGNILTIVDLFCDAIPGDERLSLDRFDGMKKKFRDQVGKLFLPEVLEAFIDMIHEEVLNVHVGRKATQVMIYAEDLTIQQPIELRLKNEGFRSVSHCSTESLLDLYGRSKPDLMVVAALGGPGRVGALIEELKSGGVDFESTPVLLVAETGSASNLTKFLEMGVEDIIVMEDNLDLLVSKIHKLSNRIATAGDGSDGAAASGTHGQLSDVNLVDLLQALGAGIKTVQITVDADGGDRITLYLNKGDIIFAELNDLVGAEAVYEALTWLAGSWNVKPLDPDALPPANNQLSNQSILMEGCRRLDEKMKAGHLV